MLKEETKEQDEEDFFAAAAHVITRFFKATQSPPGSPEKLEELVFEMEEPDSPTALSRDRTRRRFSDE